VFFCFKRNIRRLNVVLWLTPLKNSNGVNLTYSCGSNGGNEPQGLKGAWLFYQLFHRFLYLDLF